MYKIIEPFENISVSANLLKKTVVDLKLLDNFIQLQKNMSASNIMHFIKINPDSIEFLYKELPLNILINLYEEYYFLGTYINSNLIATLIEKHNKNLLIAYLNKTDASTNLLNLRNCINDKYNFIDKYFNQRLNFLKEKLKFINFDNYYICEETILVLSMPKYKNLETTNIPLVLYPKTKYITLSKGLDWYADNDYFYLDISNIHVSIRKKYFNDGYLQILLTEKSLVLDSKDIWCKLEAYQTLSEDFILKPLKKDFMQKIPLSPLTFCLKKGVVKSIETKKCYICKKFYDTSLVYERYEFMCLHCGQFNYNKRNETADLTLLCCFVSGGRQKIGLQICLKLLRCGAKVITTTRYKNACLYNYAKQTDYETFKENLIIYQCDFTKIDNLNNLINFLKTQKLNVLINNAAQTIKPSKQYYQSLKTFDAFIQKALITQSDFNCTTLQHYVTTNLCTNIYTNISIHKPLLQLVLNNPNVNLNQFGDVIDTQIKNNSSWKQKISQINHEEILEATVINQLTPTLLVNSLKESMAFPKFIINVTALEGSFSNEKDGNHVHVNMCKAALNMMVKTISKEKVKDQYIYSINSGFVSGVLPNNLKNYPLSDLDGASRILDPIIQYFKKTPLDSTWCNLKNYVQSDW